MIWNLKTIESILNLRPMSIVSIEQIVRVRSEQDLVNAIRADLHQQLTEAAKTYAVDLHTEDLVMLRYELLDSIRAYRFEVRWEPRDRPAEIMGGPHDGTIVMTPPASTILPAPLSLEVAPDLRLPEPGETHPRHALPKGQRITYNVTGWSDLHRQWIYEPAKGTP